MRKLASIQQIADVQPIEGAEAIVKVRVNGWWCVAKKGEFKVGDFCVYFEIDSLLPMTDEFAFLANRGTSKSELEDGTIVEGYRLKTIKLRGQLSQGLALPMSVLQSIIMRKTEFPRNMMENIQIALGYGDNDVTHLIGVHKYEKPMNAQLRGLARGNFPSFLRKSDQERCQNLRRQIWDAYAAEDEFQVTVKLDGSSMTAFKIDEKFGDARFGVCSRNLELKETEDNAFWGVARQLKLEEMLEGDTNIMFQGELLAPNIQGNFEGVEKRELYIYNMFDINEQKWMEPERTKNLCVLYELKHVPILHDAVTLRELFPNATQDTIIQELLDFADGPSALGGKFREGVVFKQADGQFSFKAISNSYLLKEKD